MRLFAAIDIEPEVRNKIERLQQQLKRDLNLSGKEVKWVNPDQIHLTLKFLGEVRDESLTSVCDVITHAAAGAAGFDLRVRGLGVFGRPARVVWAGIEPCPELMKLQSVMEKEYEKIGWKKESRPFAGHLTLCRVKTARAGRRLEEAVEAYADELIGDIEVDKLILYESQLTPAGAEYTAVYTVPLR